MSIVDKSFLKQKQISEDDPSAKEVEHDALLQKWCNTCIEPEEESNRRRTVVERINTIVRQWIRTIMTTEFRMPPDAASQVEGRIFATGSYRYNVHTSGSDIDMVLIAPNRITRDHFFGQLAPRFKAEPWVANLQEIRDAIVPIISMVCDGVDIDLSFGSIRQDKVPEVITDDLLQGLDDAAIRSCNAVRVAHNIMDLVPNKFVFRQALRFIKAWGKARDIYSNMFGFPSGIGWAILVAFACQCHPNQNAAGVVCRFFRIYTSWFKPNPHELNKENRAIYLTETVRVATNLEGSWDPRTRKADARALFPVLTPAVPYSNACYNVTLTNLRQLCEEFKRGDEIINTYLPKMTADEACRQLGPFGVWSKLLANVQFFGEYKQYMHIQIPCTNPHLYEGYVGGVQAKIRFLWSGTAETRGQALEDFKEVHLRLHPTKYEDPEEVVARAAAIKSTTPAEWSSAAMAANGHAPSTLRKYTAHFYVGLSVQGQVTGKINLATSIRSFHNVVRKLRQYEEGVTILPIVTVEPLSKIPSWVTGELPQSALQPTPNLSVGQGASTGTSNNSNSSATTTAATTASTTNNSTAANESTTQNSASSSTTTAGGEKRGRESGADEKEYDGSSNQTRVDHNNRTEANQNHRNGNGDATMRSNGGNTNNSKNNNNNGTTTSQGGQKANQNAVDELECALGLDF